MRWAVVVLVVAACGGGEPQAPPERHDQPLFFGGEEITSAAPMESSSPSLPAVAPPAVAPRAVAPQRPAVSETDTTFPRQLVGRWCVDIAATMALESHSGNDARAAAAYRATRPAYVFAPSGRMTLLEHTGGAEVVRRVREMRVTERTGDTTRLREVSANGVPLEIKLVTERGGDAVRLEIEGQFSEVLRACPDGRNGR